MQDNDEPKNKVDPKSRDFKRFENSLKRQKSKEKFLMIFCILSLLIGLAGNAFISSTILQEIKKPQMAVVLDEANQVTITPLKPLDQTIEIEQYCSELCMTALLSRNWQKGASYPDMLPRVFSPAAEKQVQDEIDLWIKNEAEPAKLYWAPIITDFTPHSNKDGGIIVTKVEGILKETGEFGGVLTDKSSRFVLGLRLVPNPAITQRGRFPWVCIAYSLTISEN